MSHAAALSPAQRGKIRRLAQPTEPSAGDDAGELNVVPYLDILMNVMIFVLASVSLSFASTLDVKGAFGRPSHDPAAAPLNLTVLLSRSGATFKTSGGSIAPGCGGLGSGVTVPKVGERYDAEAMKACARKLKGERADDHVTLTADPDVPYASVVAVMDALRRDGEGALFPEVSFAVVR